MLIIATLIIIILDCSMSIHHRFHKCPSYGESIPRPPFLCDSLFGYFHTSASSFFFIPSLTINRVSCNFLSTGISYISFLVMLGPSFFFISFIGHSCHLNHILVLQKTRLHIVHISFLILSSLAAQLLFLILRLRLGSIRIIPLLPTCSLFIMFVPDFFRTTLVGGSTLFVWLAKFIVVDLLSLSTSDSEDTILLIIIRFFVPYFFSSLHCHWQSQNPSC